MKINKGISLIVIIITIIIIIIIASAVILTVSSNNPIENANEAVFKQNVSTYVAELETYALTEYSSLLGAYNPNLLEADATKATYNGVAIPGKSNIYSIIPSLKSDTKNGDKFSIKKGKLIYVGTDSEVSDWVEEASLENLYIPKLSLTPNPNGSFINLQWNMNDDSQPYTYKIYQQKEGTNDFQTISTSNMNTTIKVLNIYPTFTLEEAASNPYFGTNPDITFTTWKGETVTLPKSASAKMWMESPNIENSKGYGRGLIAVDSVSIGNFNNNPTSYLFDVNGKYKYDVVYLGAWDGNGGKNFNEIAKQAIVEFIKTRRGFLTGHDTNIEYLIPYLNFSKTAVSQSYASSQLKISKKGLLTNYPWNIGEIGTILNIPLTHTQTYQNPMGEVWLQFYNSAWGQENYPECNFYLTTWNNTAMIQTGHSNGSATADEQKLLANTLFYLAQLTNETFLDDNSGQDVKAPTTPVITSATINGSTGKVDISFTASTDQGSTYNYYVEAIGQNNSSVTKTPTKSAVITSELAGYSVVVDTNPNTIPTNTVNTTSTNISITKPVGTDIYVHIKAIDNRGNYSTPIHKKVT